MWCLYQEAFIDGGERFLRDLAAGRATGGYLLSVAACAIAWSSPGHGVCVDFVLHQTFVLHSVVRKFVQRTCALEWWMPSITPNKGKQKPPLLNPPTEDEIIATLDRDEAKAKDDDFGDAGNWFEDHDFDFDHDG